MILSLINAKIFADCSGGSILTHLADFIFKAFIPLAVFTVLLFSQCSM